MIFFLFVLNALLQLLDLNSEDIVRDDSPFFSPSIDISREKIIDLTPMSRDLINDRDEQMYAKFVKGPIYLNFEPPVPYSDYSILSMPTMATYLNEMKTNSNSNPIGGSMSRATWRYNTMSTSTTGRQVTKFCLRLCEFYSQ
jgi:hypothetical protein